MKIYSDPSRAKVWVNGRYVGHTSEDVKLPFGAYEVRVEKEGYFPEVQIVLLNSSQRKRIHFKLHRIPERQPVPRGIPVPRNHPVPRDPPRR